MSDPSSATSAANARLEFAALRHYLMTDRSAFPLLAASVRRTALLLPRCQSLSKPGASLPRRAFAVSATHCRRRARNVSLSSILIAPALKRVAAAIWTPAATINCVRRQSVSLLPCCRQQRSRDPPPSFDGRRGATRRNAADRGLSPTGLHRSLSAVVPEGRRWPERDRAGKFGSTSGSPDGAACPAHAAH